MNGEELRKFAAKAYRISDASLSIDEIMLSADLKYKVTSHLRALARLQGLVAFELIEGVVMVKGGFTVENGLRNSDGSVNRKRVAEVYAAEIEVGNPGPWSHAVVVFCRAGTRELTKEQHECM